MSKTTYAITRGDKYKICHTFGSTRSEINLSIAHTKPQTRAIKVGNNSGNN